jgi:predicted GIY-YIG superfamily endonuclease
MSFAVYAIQGSNGRVYIGHSEDVERRLHAHNKGAVHSTRDDRPWILVKRQTFETREQARFFEWQLKRSKGKRLNWLNCK